MADEISIAGQLQVSNGNLKYTKQISYKATQTTANGPTPGCVSVATSGTTISLAQLTTPGVVTITNIDATNYVTYGLYISSTYYPLGRLNNGESCVFRFSTDILTANTAAAVFRMVANTATVKVQVDAFDA